MFSEDRFGLCKVHAAHALHQGVRAPGVTFCVLDGGPIRYQLGGMLHYPADAYEFQVSSQDTDGALPPPEGSGWLLIATNAAADPTDGEIAAVLIATWARPKLALAPDEKKVDS